MLQLYDPDRSQALTLQRARSARWGEFLGALRGRAGAAESQERRGHPHSHRDGHLAHHGGAVAQRSRSCIRRPSGTSGSRPGRTARAPLPCRHSDSRSTPITISATPTWWFRSMRISWRPARPACATRASSPRGAACGEARRHDEPAVRGGADAHSDGHQGRPSPAAARRRYRRVRLGAGHRARQSRKGPKNGENHDIYKWIGPIARDLQRNKGASLVIAGEQQPPIVHALAPCHERQAGQRGQDGVLHRPDRSQLRWTNWRRLQDLVKDLDAGAVDLLLISGRQPGVQCAGGTGHARPPAESQAARPPRACTRTKPAEVCQWHLPETHYLETWGDARAFDGTVTIQQPLIQPLYGGRSAYADSADR